jgi:hypothetical protein
MVIKTLPYLEISFRISAARGVLPRADPDSTDRGSPGGGPVPAGRGGEDLGQDECDLTEEDA